MGKFYLNDFSVSGDIEVTALTYLDAEFGKVQDDGGRYGWGTSFFGSSSPFSLTVPKSSAIVLAIASSSLTSLKMAKSNPPRNSS